MRRGAEEGREGVGKGERKGKNMVVETRFKVESSLAREVKGEEERGAEMRRKRVLGKAVRIKGQG